MACYRIKILKKLAYFRRIFLLNIEYYKVKGGDTVEECIFCKIISGEIPCEKIYEDDIVLSFKDINPAAPSHVLIVPKKHISSLNELKKEDSEIIAHIFIVAKEITSKLGISDSGYRIVTNCGVDGGQTVNHIHFHLLGGRSLQWPPG